MCGILAVIQNPELQTEALSAALGSMKHRGPDNTGTFSDAEIFLGYHRLAVQDISPRGNQPMQNADGRFVLVYNGEIYNHLALRKDLEKKGAQFHSASDTETLLQGFCMYGEAILPKLNGIFAFAIYDRKEHTLFAARDPIGVKPLYYYRRGNHFACASEIKSFLYLPDFDDSIDHCALVNYLNFLWSPGERTPFLHVHKLLPGYFLKISTKLPETSWQLRKYSGNIFSGAREYYPQNTWIETVDRKISEAVGRQMLSDIPVGFFLSGGIDSSLLVAAARKSDPGRRITCFTIRGTKETEKEGFGDDFQYAGEVAKYLGVDLQAVEGGTDILADFDTMIWHLDEPQADIAPLYVYKISQAAAAGGMHVLIGGVGGDDIFSGYRRHQALQFDKFLQYMPGFALQALAGMMRTKGMSNPTLRRLNKLLKRKNSDRLNRLIGYYEWFPVLHHAHIFTPDMQQKIAGFDPDRYFYDLLSDVEDEDSLLNKMLYLELKTFLPDHNLNYTDKMGMAHGVEIRVPYLDLELVQLCARMPPQFKLRGSKTKYALRRIAEQRLPASVVHRKKTGFGPPLRQWLLHEMNSMAQDRLNMAMDRKDSIFDPSAIRALWDNTQAGRIDGSYTLLSIMAIDSWMRQFTKRNTLRSANA